MSDKVETDSRQVLIVGGGLAGLSCARELAAAGLDPQVLEAGEIVGGRAATDCVDGFLLDRGFQVLLTAYPEAQTVLDYDALQLCRFEPGALIRCEGKFHALADPWRSPGRLLQTAFSPVATLADKWKVGRLRARLCGQSLAQLAKNPATPTIDALRKAGFSDRIIERFFRPFLGGVFLDRDLETTSRMFEFVFRMFSLGDAALPATGMGAMARQLRDGLPPEAVRTNTVVTEVAATSVRLASGEQLHGRAVVVAADGPATARLLGRAAPPGRGVTCLYFAAAQAPIEAPILVLNGESQGPINNLCVPSQVAPSYAPADQALVSVTVLGVPADEAALLAEVRNQLVDWFGKAADKWRHLKTYTIPYALPVQLPPDPSSPDPSSPDPSSPGASSAELPGGGRVFVCGDLTSGSIQGALVSGRRAADAVREAVAAATA